jgi:hypothetical protein
MRGEMSAARFPSATSGRRDRRPLVEACPWPLPSGWTVTGVGCLQSGETTLLIAAVTPTLIPVELPCSST